MFGIVDAAILLCFGLLVGNVLFWILRKIHHFGETEYRPWTDVRTKKFKRFMGI